MFKITDGMLGAKEDLSDLEKQGNTHKMASDFDENHSIRFIIPENSTVEVLAKMTDSCSFVCLLFPRCSHRTGGSRRPGNGSLKWIFAALKRC